MLKIEDIHVSIQSVVALRGLSLEVADGTMVGLVGRNGAGKTTLMRSVMGHLKPSAGTISFNGQDLGKLPPRDFFLMIAPIKIETGTGGPTRIFAILK